jgi:hypothetical protein
MDRLDQRRGGGYTNLAMVADVHPITHPKKTKRIVLRLSWSAPVATTIHMNAQTIAQPMLYAV